MPKTINFGKNALSETQYPKNALVVTTAPPDVSSKWLTRMNIQDYMLYDKVEPEPSTETVNKVMAEFKPKNPSAIIGLGGGSSLDVAKYAGMEMKIPKILIPTTFGTGAEMTTYCVLKFEGKKKLLQDERFLADMAVIDSYFMDGTPEAIVKNSVCDACAQATEGYDSKWGNFSLSREKFFLVDGVWIAAMEGHLLYRCECYRDRAQRPSRVTNAKGRYVLSNWERYVEQGALGAIATPVRKAAR